MICEFRFFTLFVYQSRNIKVSFFPDLILVKDHIYPISIHLLSVNLIHDPYIKEEK